MKRKTEEENITEWLAVPGRHDAVESVALDGRVRRVTFPLGQIARDRFLKTHREQLKMVARQSTPGHLASPGFNN